MNNKIYYVTSWNDEYLDNCILSGPMSLEDAQAFMKEHVIQRLKDLGLDDEYSAEDAYSCAASDNDDAIAEVEYFLSVGKRCACIAYSNYEERISIVRYERDNSEKQEARK